jgi:hypothetical protein
MSNRWLPFMALLPLAGCAAAPASTRASASTQIQHCSDAPPEVASRLVGSASVEGVEPLYGVANSNPNGQESHLLGATIHLRPREPTTVEAVTHALYCFGAAEAIRGDSSCPYWLEGPVDIAVNFGEDAYVVTLQGRDPREATEILTRARAFRASPSNH